MVKSFLANIFCWKVFHLKISNSPTPLWKLLKSVVAFPLGLNILEAITYIPFLTLYKWVGFLSCRSVTVPQSVCKISSRNPGVLNKLNTSCQTISCISYTFLLMYRMYHCNAPVSYLKNTRRVQIPIMSNSSYLWVMAGWLWLNDLLHTSLEVSSVFVLYPVFVQYPDFVEILVMAWGFDWIWAATLQTWLQNLGVCVPQIWSTGIVQFLQWFRTSTLDRQYPSSQFCLLRTPVVAEGFE